MAMHESLNEFVDLVMAFQDGTATETQVESLNEQLEKDERKREIYLMLTLQEPLLETIDFNGLETESRPENTLPIISRIKLPLAIAATLILGVTIWVLQSPTSKTTNENPDSGTTSDHTQNPGLRSAQVGSWQISTRDRAARWEVDQNRIKLLQGEIMLQSPAGESSSFSPVCVETPAGQVHVASGLCYIGSHDLDADHATDDLALSIKQTQKGVIPMKRPFTRALVLSGVATLITALGSVEGGPNTLLAAEADQLPERQQVVAGNTQFAIDLYKQLSDKDKGNLFFSPYSISSALAMTAEGARGQTAKEIGNVLHFPKAARRIGDGNQQIPWQTSMIHSGFADINKMLQSRDQAEIQKMRDQLTDLEALLDAKKAELKELNGMPWVEARAEEAKLVDQINNLRQQIDPCEINVANALWGENTYPFNQDFIDTIDNSYETGGAYGADFKNNCDEARQKINRWVEAQTRDRIKELLAKGSLNRLTRMVLVNAIYFKGSWSQPFKQEATKKKTFKTADGQSVKHDLMYALQKKGNVRYAAFNGDGSVFDVPHDIEVGKPDPGFDPKGFAMAEIAYKGGDLSMLLVVPNNADGLVRIESQLDGKNLAKWTDALNDRRTHIYLPKFKIDPPAATKLKEPLQNLGMELAFIDPRNPDGADFSGLNASGEKELYIDDVVHKAFVEVNEKGTEAAAATAVLVATPESAAEVMYRSYTPAVRADRPFIYMIRHNKTGSILFMGRMSNPS